jgi:hypothetical protein
VVCHLQAETETRKDKTRQDKTRQGKTAVIVPESRKQRGVAMLGDLQIGSLQGGGLGEACGRTASDDGMLDPRTREYDSTLDDGKVG